MRYPYRIVKGRGSGRSRNVDRSLCRALFAKVVSGSREDGATRDVDVTHG